MGKEFNDGPLNGLFAATPPLAVLRSLISEAATTDAEEEEVEEEDEEEEEEKIIAIDDASRAFFEAPIRRDVCVELPEETLTEAEKNLDLVGHLQMSLHGTRDAVMNWQEEIAVTMIRDGFKRGRYYPCLYYHPRRKVKALVQGDDFVSVGTRTAVQSFNAVLKKRFEIKLSIIGSRRDLGEVRETKVLNRVVRLTGSRSIQRRVTRDQRCGVANADLAVRAVVS